MFWIILAIIGAVLSTYGYIKTNNFNKNRGLGITKKDPVFVIVCTIICAISTFISIIQGIEGITDYPYLVSELAKAETLQARVKNIKNANYKHKNGGTLVTGSIENWKQSTNLSNYIVQLVKVEAEYNSYLKLSIAYKKTFVLYFFGPGWAISNKIYDLKYISK